MKTESQLKRKLFLANKRLKNRKIRDSHYWILRGQIKMLKWVISEKNNNYYRTMEVWDLNQDYATWDIK